MKVNESLSRDLFRLLVWYPFRWLLQLLPVSVSFMFLRLMGKLHYLLVTKGERVQREPLFSNLGPIVSKPHLRRSVIKNYYINHYVDQLFILIASNFGKREVEKFIEFKGLQNLDKALARGKGVVLAHGHFGPAHMPLVALARLGYRMKQIGNPSDEGLSWIGRNVAFRLRMAYERKMPAQIIKVDSFLRPVYRALKKNNVIMITGDGSGRQERFGRYHAYCFFGEKVAFPVGAASLSEKTGAVLLPMFITPGSSKQFQIVIGEALESSLPGEEKIFDLTGKFLVQLERQIGDFPWYWHFLDRFSVGMMIEEGAPASRLSLDE